MDEPRPAPGAPPPGAGPLPLRRLSRAEYDNTLRDLLGATGSPAAEFATDSRGASGFDEGSLVAVAEIDRMTETMERLARAAVGASPPGPVACDLGRRGEEACADEFVRVFGRRAFRHPLGSEEAADLMAVYADARKLGLDFRGGVQTVLTAMLLSPRFHYHWPLGDRPPRLMPGGLVVLDGFELASRLSYFVWQSMPDDALLDAAERGELASPAGVLGQAERMLRDPQRGPRGGRGFFAGWLDLGTLDARSDADPAAARTFGAMAEETMLFVDDLLLGAGDRRLATLLTASYSFANDAVAKLYGVAGVTGAQWRRISLEPAARGGILTQPAFLAASYGTPLSTPIHRGRFIFERLATCRPLAPPEGDIPEIRAATGPMSIRQQLDQHTAGACAGCHRFMDPIGFAFGGYDHLGRTRTRDENGQPIDAAGVLPGVAGGELRFDGAVDLSRKLAQLPEAQRCFATQMFRYALKTAPTVADQASLDAAAGAFSRSGDIRDLMLGMTQIFAFHHRAPNPGEVLP